MKTKRNIKLYEQVRQAVHKQWDPIGISDFTEEMGEYDGYVPTLCRLIEKHAGYGKIFKYLWTIETESMGLSGNKQLTEDFSKWLCELR